MFLRHVGLSARNSKLSRLGLIRSKRDVTGRQLLMQGVATATQPRCALVEFSDFAPCKVTAPIS